CGGVASWAVGGLDEFPGRSVHPAPCHYLLAAGRPCFGNAGRRLVHAAMDADRARADVAAALAHQPPLARRRGGAGAGRGNRPDPVRGDRRRDSDDIGRRGDLRRHRLDRARYSPFRPYAGRARFFPIAADLGAARRGLPARRGHARAHRCTDRNPARCIDGLRRHAVVPVAACYCKTRLAVRLEARDLAFGYRGHPVGRDVSLALGAGEVMCLLGPNGSGKTTLFKTLLGLLPAQGGRVLMDGAELSGRKRNEIARMVSYVPQAHAAFFPFSVSEVVLMGRTAHVGVFSSPSRQDQGMAAAALERMGLAHLADSIYTRVSGGERQLTLIARALAQDARIVVMDEPTANLDFGNQVRVLQHIQSLAQSGIGVLLSTHDPDQAFLCANRVAMLHDGRLARVGTPYA